MATLADIARKAGVSPAVVSRIINGDKTLRVSLETRARVEAVVRAMNFAPNVAAQSLRSSRSGTIAFVVHDVANPVYGEILRGAQEEAERQNKAILLGDAAASNVSNSRLAQMIGGGGVDGLVLQAAGLQSDNLILGAAHEKVTVVQLQADLGMGDHLILLPDRDAAALATRHLRELGHRHIACLATYPGLTFTEDRLRGWRETMGEDADEALVVHSGPLAVEGEAAMRDLFARRRDFSGLVCFNVVSAIGALRAARALGISVPDELSVISIHDVKFAQDLRVPLSVVRMPLSELGRAAIQMVSEDSVASATRVSIESPPELIVRASTTRPP
ncbi:MAG: LacI family DNA-binding transcriptional regulator [Pseudomonadota bacterium]